MWRNDDAMRLASVTPGRYALCCSRRYALHPAWPIRSDQDRREHRDSADERQAPPAGYGRDRPDYRQGPRAEYMREKSEPMPLPMRGSGQVRAIGLDVICI
jgi:hypothetical protein